MADSTKTKRAMATALKELMETTPFEKINVAQIADRCGMSRKSFYYHFKDKYDLINWIFDEETGELVKDLNWEDTYSGRMEQMERICDYFYENRDFYRRALRIQGQNSFSEHLWEQVRPILKARLTRFFPGKPIDEFYVDFLADATCCSIARWLKDKNCMTPGEFVSKIDRMTQQSVRILHQEMTSQREASEQKGE